jgi:hypothetical protein
MSLTNLMGLLEQYANPATSSGANVEQDFDHVSQNAPPAHLATGLTEAFQSKETPPFPQMLGNLFSNSNGQQQAGILNMLLGAAGPAGSGILEICWAERLKSPLSRRSKCRPKRFTNWPNRRNRKIHLSWSRLATSTHNIRH